MKKEMGKFFKYKGIFLFFVTFIFFFMFLISSNQFVTAQPNNCRKQDGTVALKTHYACGKDTLYYQTNPNKIFECVDSRGGLVWDEERDCGSVGCVTEGNGAKCLGEDEEFYIYEDDKNQCFKSDGSQANTGHSSCGKDTKFPNLKPEGIYICTEVRSGHKGWFPSGDCGHLEDCITTDDKAECEPSTWGIPSGPAPTGEAPPEIGGIIPVIYDAIKFFFGFIAIVAAAMVVYGAYMWMFSGGDPQKVKAAQGVLTWAVIGLIFFMLIVVFFEFILRIFGIDLPLPDTPF